MMSLKKLRKINSKYHSRVYPVEFWIELSKRLSVYDSEYSKKIAELDEAKRKSWAEAKNIMLD